MEFPQLCRFHLCNVRSIRLKSKAVVCAGGAVGARSGGRRSAPTQVSLTGYPRMFLTRYSSYRRVPPSLLGKMISAFPKTRASRVRFRTRDRIEKRDDLVSVQYVKSLLLSSDLHGG